MAIVATGLVDRSACLSEPATERAEAELTPTPSGLRDGSVEDSTVGRSPTGAVAGDECQALSGTWFAPFADILCNQQIRPPSSLPYAGSPPPPPSSSTSTQIGSPPATADGETQTPTLSTAEFCPTEFCPLEFCLPTGSSPPYEAPGLSCDGSTQTAVNTRPIGTQTTRAATGCYQDVLASKLGTVKSEFSGFTYIQCESPPSTRCHLYASETRIPKAGQPDKPSVLKVRADKDPGYNPGYLLEFAPYRNAAGKIQAYVDLDKVLERESLDLANFLLARWRDPNLYRHALARSHVCALTRSHTHTFMHSHTHVLMRLCA